MKNPDGDVSLNASPDSGYADMLNANNRSGGGLDLEIVPRDQPDCTRGQPLRAGNSDTAKVAEATFAVSSGSSLGERPYA